MFLTNQPKLPVRLLLEFRQRSSFRSRYMALRRTSTSKFTRCASNSGRRRRRPACHRRAPGAATQFRYRQSDWFNPRWCDIRSPCYVGNRFIIGMGPTPALGRCGCRFFDQLAKLVSNGASRSLPPSVVIIRISLTSSISRSRITRSVACTDDRDHTITGSLERCGGRIGHRRTDSSTHDYDGAQFRFRGLAERPTTSRMLSRFPANSTGKSSCPPTARLD